MNKKYYVTIGLLVLLLLLALWRIDNVQGKLKLEKSEHSKTQEQLADALEKGKQWEAAYREAKGAAERQATATQACLDREKAAIVAKEERTDILRNAKPRPQTETEKRQVVDDETRKRSADRLNRPL